MNDTRDIRDANNGPGWAAVWPMLLLCVWLGSRWLAADVWPSTASTLLSEAVACAVCAVAAAVYYRRDFLRNLRLRFALLVAGAGAGLLAGPAIGAALRGPAGEPMLRSAAMVFVPFVLAILVGTRAKQSEGLRLGPGLSAIGGALLLFPVTLPDSVIGYVGTILPPLLIAAALAFWPECAVGRGVRATLFFAGGAAGLVALLVVGHAAHSVGSLYIHASAVAMDAATAVLTLFALARCGRSRYAAVFVGIPLLTTVEGMVVFRPDFSLRMTCGLLLMAAAVIAIWRAGASDAATLSLKQD